MPRFGVQAIKGLTGVRKAFRAADPIIRERLNFATDITAKALAGQARMNCPTDSGTLKNAIVAKPPSPSGFARVGIENKVVYVNGKSKRPHLYAHLVEFGFVHVGGKRVAGRPFMIPAAEGQRSVYAQRVAAEMKAAEAEIAANAEAVS
jgi:hypothetical protein